MDPVRVGRDEEQPECDRCRSPRLLERAGAVAAGVRRERVLRAEWAAPALRFGEGRTGRKGRDPLALGRGADTFLS